MKKMVGEDGLAKTPEEVLEQGLCNCGSVRTLVDESIDAAIANRAEGCAVWAMMKTLMAVQMQANLFNLGATIEKGQKKANAETTEFMNEMTELSSNIMMLLKDHVKERIIAKVQQKAAELDSTHEGHTLQ